MQEFQAELSARGFSPPQIALDGVLRRFDRNGKENAWIIGWQHFSAETGEAKIIADYGDWRTGERHEYRPTKMSNADKAAIKSKLADGRRRYEEAKAEKHREAAAKAKIIFDGAATEGVTEYMTRKKIAGLYGCKLSRGEIVVPMQQVGDDALCGLQFIPNEKGKRKLFLTGSRAEGACHVIEGTGDGLYLCEGFATGASIHQATGKTVVVAFSAGNLVPVARALRASSADVAITVCADDDRFTKHPKTGEPWNPGREAADKAATLIGGSVSFPLFSSDDGNPTDFNDLHCNEGLEQVKKQLAPDAVESRVQFIPLGYDEGTHFFYVTAAKDIMRVSTFSKSQLFSLAPQDYWAQKYELKTGWDTESAINDLIQMSQKVGPFDAGRIRGTGVWRDRGRVVINTGFGLRVDGREIPMTSFKSRYIYVQTKHRMPMIHAQPLTVDECKVLLDACTAFKWQKEHFAHLLAGWIAIARIAGALPVHPHIWITGGAGTGKSTVLEGVVKNGLGSPKGSICAQGGSTEAGIRQEIKSSSLPVRFDEFETLNEAANARVDSMTELARNSWSATAGSILKGSVSGNSVAYIPCFPCLFASVRVRFTNDADRSRFSVLELREHGNSPEQWRELQAIVARITEEYGERLFARMAGMVNVVIASQEVLGRVLARKISQRFGQQVGTILAGTWALMSDEVITQELAENLVAELDLTEDRANSEDTDEIQCLTKLMTSRVTFTNPIDGRCDDTIEEMVLGVGKNSSLLKVYGIKVESSGIVVANSHDQLEKLFARTRWADGVWRRSLLRLKGAKPSDQTERFGSKVSRGVWIPMELLMKSSV